MADYYNDLLAHAKTLERELAQREPPAVPADVAGLVERASLHRAAWEGETETKLTFNTLYEDYQKTADALAAQAERIAELERLTDNLRHYRDEAVFAKGVAEGELAEARRDAERYRWLRARPNTIDWGDHLLIPNDAKTWEFGSDRGKLLDAAIDAAKAGK